MHKIIAALALTTMLLVAAPAPAQRNFVTFDKGDVTIQTGAGPQKFTVELATDEVRRAQGLAYRQRMAADAGMLFVYPHPQQATMWMKDMFIPLDVVFIGPDDRIANIRERAVPQSQAIIPSDGPVKAVLELNAGTVSRLGLKRGDQVAAPSLAN
jgi:uncharacterized membrane protein (UPF0127 family)